MTLQSWILLLTGIIVGIPAAWMVWATIRGPRKNPPTFWCELPAAAPPGFHVVVALAASVEERVPAEQVDVQAISIAHTGEPVGLVLASGTYWLYAIPTPGPVGLIQAVDLVIVAARSGPAAFLPVGASPVTISSPAPAKP